MKKLGNAGLLGINKPVEFGGLGLDYKYQVSNSDQFQMQQLSQIFQTDGFIETSPSHVKVFAIRAGLWSVFG